MLTTELTLLMAIYAFLILGLFYNGPGPNNKKGIVSTFEQNLPLLSTRIEQNVITGKGFSETWEPPL